MEHIAQGKRSDTLGSRIVESPRPVRAKALYLFPTLNAFAPSGRQYYGNPIPRVSLRLPWAMCSIGLLLTLSAAAQQFKQA